LSDNKLLVNVYDRYFFGAPSCVKGKTPTLVNIVHRQPDFDGISLYVDVCMYEEARESNSKYKIGWLLEARGLHPGDYERATEALQWLDFIITYDSELLKKPGFVSYIKGGIWIPREQWGLHEKTKLCSMLYGAKTQPMPGYPLRHQVAEIARQHGVDVYYETGRTVAAKLAAIKDYAFTIVIDACRIDNAFAENLLDPIMLGCVPIHWGAPNIGEFLDKCGIISLSDISQVENILQNLTMGRHNLLRPILWENLERARNWEITEDWISLNILLPFLDGKINYQHHP
jgi:hypothetical protein